MVLAVFAVNAQRTISDSVNGNETVNFTAMTDPVAISILATQTGGTTDGTVTLQGSVDGTTYTTIQPTAGVIYYLPSDTSKLTGYTWTMTNGASLLIGIEQPFWRYYRVRAAGTVGDSTLVTIKWMK